MEQELNTIEKEESSGFKITSVVSTMKGILPKMKGTQHTYVSFKSPNSFIYCTESKGYIIVEEGKKVTEVQESSKNLKILKKIRSL